MIKVVLFVSMFFIALGVSAQSMYGDAVSVDVKMKYVYSFEEALALAKKENKPIFFNCFADWAIPCHSMNKFVFSNQKFADWMNKHFVNFFIDVTTLEGRPLAEKYDIRFQAHYLVLNSNGEILLRVVGGYKLPEFQELISLALNSKTTLPGMNKRYADGERNVKFLRDYVRVLKLADESKKADQVTDEFFARLKKSEWYKKENWNLFQKKANNLNSEKFQFMLEHKYDFVKHNGEEIINQFITGVYVRELYSYTYGESYDTQKLLDLYLDMQKSNLPDTSMAYTVYDIAKYRREKNVSKLIDILENRTPGWEDRIVAGFDLGLLELKDLSTADENRIITYLKKKMDGMQGSLLNMYREALNKVENTGGMQFVDLTFNEVLDKAKKEGKLVFMDCYTTWCGPCKTMSNQVFPLKFVGDFMNEHFVNVKIDMERGEGIELAKQYGVRAFPTMFLLNAKGEPIYKILGAQDPRIFLEKIKRGMTLENSYITVKEKYAAGDRSVSLVADYYLIMQEETRDVEKLNQEVISYLSTLDETDRFSKSTWKLYSNFINEYASPEFKYLVMNRQKFEQVIGKDVVNKKIEKVIFPAIIDYLRGEGMRENMQIMRDLILLGKFPVNYSLTLLNEIVSLYDSKDFDKMLDFYEDKVASIGDASTRLNLDVLLKILLQSASIEQRQRASDYARKCEERVDSRAKNNYKALIEALAK